jgi:hypothetical protein
MLRKLMNGYREWENEVMAVLEQPAMAAHVAPGLRGRLARRVAQRVAAMSPVEHRQMLDFVRAYRGRNTRILVTLCSAFTLGGVLLHLLLPDLTTWAGSVIAANMLGFILAGAATSAWFSYRCMIRERNRRLGLGLALGLLPVALLVCVELLEGASTDQVLAKLARMVPVIVITAMVVGAPLYAIAFLRNRKHEELTAQLQRDAEHERLARELSESRLRLLRAQIEPHFLFNTLGAVQQLAEHGVPKAAELTANLIAFLRASLSDMRSEQVSLAAEFALVQAYLRVMQVRLGARLRVGLSLPDELVQVRVPSMILLTLAENAIKHGIEPSLRGGEVLVSATAAGGELSMRVQDSGVGLSATPGEGMGLDNVRRRLLLAYGADATLTLHEADPGLIADITIPYAPEQQ